MDIIIFCVALILLYKRKYSWVIATIVTLSSNLLEINWVGGIRSDFIIPHQITDVGLILYLIYFFSLVWKNGIYTKHPVSKYVIFFYIFLFTNSLIDIFYGGVEFVDVIAYTRIWVFLSIVWISPTAISQKELKKSFVILIYIVAITTVIILYENITKDFTLVKPISADRGIKPSIFVTLFTVLLFLKAVKLNIITRYLFLIIFISSIVINLKQTYLFTVAFTIVGYILIYQRKQMRFSKFFLYFSLAITSFSVLILVNDSLYARVSDVFREKEAMSSNEVEGNFSFRILHSSERLNYILIEPYTAMRGIGFIHEKSFKKDIFLLGAPTPDGDIPQLDAGDIAWSQFIVRFGLVGIFLFILFYISILRYLKKQSNVSLISKVFMVFMLVSLLFMSLGNATIAYGYFYILPLLAGHIINK